MSTQLYEMKVTCKSFGKKSDDLKKDFNLLMPDGTKLILNKISDGIPLGGKHSNSLIKQVQAKIGENFKIEKVF